LIALYEHRVFVQAAIWDINAFDQWGVELGKALASRLLPVVRDGAPADTLDPSTRGLVERLRTLGG
jgi:glucose-6-phosphate isomerase